MNRFATAACLALLLIFSQAASATTWCVSFDGSGGCFTSIQSAINGAATGDTIKVLPGVYDEKISISKQIVILGSGFEVCAIAYSGPVSDAAVSFLANSAGSKISAMRISSSVGRGVNASSSGTVTVANCFIAYCFAEGLSIGSGTFVNVRNCVIAENASHGVTSGYGAAGRVSGSIIYGNGGFGLYSYSAGVASNNNLYYQNTSANITGVAAGPQDLLNLNPQFVSYDTDLHLQPGSPCVNTGIPGIDSQDCDGSANDMGVYGGPDAVCGPGPVVESMIVIPPAVIKGETFKIQAKGVTR